MAASTERGQTQPIALTTLRDTRISCDHQLRWAHSKIHQPLLYHIPAGRQHRCPPGWYAPNIFICGEKISRYNSSYFPGKGWTCPRDGWSLEQREHFPKISFTLAVRINQASRANYTKDDQSVFLPLLLLQVLEDQFNKCSHNNPGESVSSRCVWVMYLISSF